jgi:hypothetical protein
LFPSLVFRTLVKRFRRRRRVHFFIWLVHILIINIIFNIF